MTLFHQPVQSRLDAPTSYENALADELEAVYGRGVHDLPGVVAALNESGVRPPDGRPWTEPAFVAELARLSPPEV